MVINPSQAGAKARPGMGPVILRMEGQRIGVCDPGPDREDSSQPKKPSLPDEQARASCRQSAASFEYWAFLGTQPSCVDSDSVHSFCDAVKDFDGFLNLGSREAGDEAALASLPAARGAAMSHPLAAAAALCSFQVPDVRLRLCGAAEGAGKYSFLLGQCPEQARALAQRQCAGADMAVAPAPVREFCSRYQARMGQAQGK